MADLTLQNLFDVKGKVVLVTGGGRGVGEMVSPNWLRCTYVPRSFTELSPRGVRHGILTAMC